MTDLNQLLALLLGGGAVATVTALFNGVKSLREGARSRELDTIGDLVRRRQEAEEDRDKAFRARDHAFNERDYWRNWTGILEYAMLQRGIELPPKPTMLEEERHQ